MSSLRALRPERYPEGSERLSAEIDAIVYGAKAVIVLDSSFPIGFHNDPDAHNDERRQP